MYLMNSSGSSASLSKQAIFAALTLYLDFINLFIFFVKIIWSKKINLFLKFFPISIF